MAREVCPKYGINYEKLEKDERNVEIRMSQVGIEDWKNIPWVNGKLLDTLNVKRCPWCEKGYLVEVTEKYGSIVRCTSHPNCSYTENFEEQDINMISKMRDAYKIRI